MKLHILRHAKTEAVASTQVDFDRKLLPKGIAQATQMGEYLRERLSEDMKIFCSTSARTRQTAELVGEQYAFRNIEYLDRLYHASLQMLLDFIWAMEGNREFMIIGHNEGISDLASYFLDDFISLKTCGYTCIEFEAGSWAEVSKGLGKPVDSYRPEVKS